MADTPPPETSPRKVMRDVLIIVASWLGVTVAAILQFTLVLGVQIQPRKLVVPMLVGVTVGFVLRRLVRFREHERALLQTLKDRESVIMQLNRDLEAQVEERTAALRLKEAELLQSQKMEALGRLAGGVAHDFNNLLTTIVGSASLLEEALSPYDAGPRELVEEIQVASERATRLTRQLLTMSRKQVLRREAMSMAEVIDAMLPLLRRLISEDVELKADIDFSCPPIFSDRTQMEQMVLNLCVNARDAMPRGGSLAISLHKATPAETAELTHPDPRGYCVLSVADNGTGMSDEVKAHIFEPFFTTKDIAKGTGLGLSVVHGIVESADGRVIVDSEPDEGTTFRVFLPLTERAVPAGQTKAIEQDVAPDDVTVLVVEDEPAVRRFVKHVLSGRGYSVLEASSGTEAISRAQHHEGDIGLVLTDVVMPGMSGPETAEAILAFRPGASVMFMTGYPGDEISERVGQLDGVTALQKPFDAQTLLSNVARVLKAMPPSRARLQPGSPTIN